MLCNYETMRIEILKEYIELLIGKLTELEESSEAGLSRDFICGFEAAIDILEKEANENQ